MRALSEMEAVKPVPHLPNPISIFRNWQKLSGKDSIPRQESMARGKELTIAALWIQSHYESN